MLLLVFLRTYLLLFIRPLVSAPASLFFVLCQTLDVRLWIHFTAFGVIWHLNIRHIFMNVEVFVFTAK